MSAGQPTPQVSLDKRFELYQDYIKTVLNLSAGALVLSVTFLHDILGVGSAEINRAVAGRGLLATSWLAFLGSVLGSLFYLYVLSLATKFESAFSKQLQWGAALSVVGLVVGLATFAVFGWLNIP